jgi:hypothetical protein
MKTRFSRTFVLFAALLALLPLAAVAQTCVPIATGVFGNPTPPHWWDNVPPQSVYYQQIDDPRWVGSGTITYGDGSSTQADFRALLGDSGANLYLSWRIFLAPAMSANQNSLYIGLQQAGGAGDMIIHIALPTLAPGADTVPSYDVETLQADGTLGATIPTPTWLSDTGRVWINNPTLNSFAVEVRVPVSAITVSGGAFSMWYEVLAGTPSAAVYKFTWPRSGADITTSGFPAVQHFPTSALPWQSFHLNTGPGDPACAGTGVSLDIYQIGTHNLPDSSAVLYKEIPPGVPPAPINTFFARPRNDSGATINTGDIKATFRLANWGSVPGDESGVPANVLWSTIPGGSLVPTSGNIPNGTLADGTNEAHFDWTLSNADIVPYKNGTRSSDNCLLVELTSTTGLTFTNSSIRRNMDFVSASTFTRKAQISIKGLTPFSPDGRDVYLYVETLNMPAKIKPGGDGGTGNPTTPAGRTGNPNGPLTPQQLQELAARGEITDQAMDASLPTYRVHVFSDSGTTITVGGTKHPLLVPQGGFGFRVIHAGDLIGWTHQIFGDGFTLQEIAPNFYRIKKVPNGGAVNVVTTITAVEPGGSGGGPGTGKFRVFLDAGPNFPHGDLNKAVDGRYSVNAGLEGFVASNTSIEGILGYHAFKSPVISNPRIWQLSVNVKQYFGPGPLHFFINGGAGGYRFDPGNTTKLGGNVGAGLLWDISSTWGLEAVYNFHAVSTSGSNTEFSTLQVGIRHSLF